jgi:AraC family transcriptional regulator, transcriptional activator of pobA
MQRNLSKIPILKPSEFDDYIFMGWKPHNSDFYEKFHIERIENYKDNLKLPLAPHRRSVYFFVYLVEGNAIRSKGLTKYDIRAKQFFFLPAHQITALEYISEDIRGFYCHFSLEIFNESALDYDIEKRFPFFQHTSEPVIIGHDSERLEQILEILFIENHKNEQKRFGLIPSYLNILFSELKYQDQAAELKVNNTSARITQAYKHALSEKIYEKKTVREFADYLSISANHLHKCVKQITGKSAHELLNEMRILEAKVLLKQSHLSIGEIAFKVGQFESSDFSRLFKKNTKLTPKQYRNLQFD